MKRASFISRLALLGSAAVALPSLFACLDHPLKPVEYDQAQEKQDNIALTVNKDVDILFVIDNSGSMGEEQGTLANNFEAFINVLEAENVKANYRIGITTTDNGNPWCSGTTPEGGALRLSSCKSRIEEFTFTGTDPPTNKADEACNNVCQYDTITTSPTETEDDQTPKSRPWLESIEGATNIEGGATAAEAFKCVGPQGINGCGFESHLESMYKGLKRAEDSNESSYSFLRKNAILSVIFVTDEVDCSYQNDYRSIFEADGDRTYWSDPDAMYPTSAVCWNAGVTCTGGPGTYDECHSEDKDELGNPTGPGTAVLHPVSRYTELLQGFESQKQAIQPNQEVLVAVIGGVPSGYEDGQEIVYQDTQDAAFQGDYGVGPGCSSTAGVALPPVRMKQFAEYFQVTTRNLYSVCADDYSPALRAIADAIADQVRPACMPACVADTNPTTPELDASCSLIQEMPTDQGPVEQSVPACNVDVNAGTWDFPSGANVCYRELTKNSTATDIDDMSDQCIDEGWNLEFALERREGFPAPGGTVVRATCELSQNKAVDCPDLG